MPTIPELLAEWRSKQAAWFDALDSVAHAQENGAPRREMERLRVREEETRQARNRAYWNYSRAERGFAPLVA